MNEQNIFIVRTGEVALKGMNKPYFERVLVQRIRAALKKTNEQSKEEGNGGIDVYRHEGLIFIKSPKTIPEDTIIKLVSRVFGVSSISPAWECESNLDAIGEMAVKFMLKQIEERGVKTFKVFAKRADKTFPIKSPEIARIIGAKVLIGCKVLKVDVHNPEVRLHVDLRRGVSYIYDEKVAAIGGLPLGTNGRGLILLSGGIDSPVAA